MLPNIFHALSKNAIAHQLKKAFLKLILCTRPKPGIQHNKRLHPFTIFEVDNPVYSFSF